MFWLADSLNCTHFFLRVYYPTLIWSFDHLQCNWECTNCVWMEKWRWWWCMLTRKSHLLPRWSLLDKEECMDFYNDENIHTMWMFQQLSTRNNVHIENGGIEQNRFNLEKSWTKVKQKSATKKCEYEASIIIRIPDSFPFSSPSTLSLKNKRGQ